VIISRHWRATRLDPPACLPPCSTPGAPEGRIIVLSSVTQHYASKEGILPEDRINSPEGYDAWQAYGQVTLHCLELTPQNSIECKVQAHLRCCDADAEQVGQHAVHP
jgi:hypothetical protein